MFHLISKNLTNEFSSKSTVLSSIKFSFATVRKKEAAKGFHGS
jgi:hypothetical protein